MSQHSSILPHPPAVEQPRPKSSKPDWLLMLRQFFRHGKTIASFVPISRFLSKKLIKGIDWDKSQCIVELGAERSGDPAIGAPRKSHTKLIVIEQDPDFCRRWREKFPSRPNLNIVEGDACKLDSILAERGITVCDHVLSGLPLPSFPAPLREVIMAASHKVLPPHGTFRQLTNMPWIYWRMYKNYFNNVRFSLVPLNLPPAGVLSLQQLQRSAALRPSSLPRSLSVDGLSLASIHWLAQSGSPIISSTVQNPKSLLNEEPKVPLASGCTAHQEAKAVLAAGLYPAGFMCPPGSPIAQRGRCVHASARNGVASDLTSFFFFRNSEFMGLTRPPQSRAILKIPLGWSISCQTPKSH